MRLAAEDPVRAAISAEARKPEPAPTVREEGRRREEVVASGVLLRFILEPKTKSELQTNMRDADSLLDDGGKLSILCRYFQLVSVTINKSQQKEVMLLGIFADCDADRFSVIGNVADNNVSMIGK